MTTATATTTTAKSRDKKTGQGTPTLTELAVTAITPNPDNPRKDLGDLTELAASIASQGIQQPLVVSPADGKTYMLVMGHRRYAAAVKAGLNTVPCIVRKMETRKQAELMLVENTQRSSLTAIEEARGYARLLDLGEDEDQMAKATGRSRATVRRRLKVAAIDTDLLPDGRQISFDQLETIADYREWPDLQARLARAAGGRNWASEKHDIEQEKRTLDWAEDARKTAKELGLAIVEGVTERYRTVEGYTKVGTLDTDQSLADKMADMSKAARDGMDSIGIVTTGPLWGRGAVLLRKLTPEEHDAEKKREEDHQKALSDFEEREVKREETSDRLFAFTRKAEDLMEEHMAVLAHRPLPAKTQVEVMADLTLYLQRNPAPLPDGFGAKLAEPWGKDTSILDPDEKHRPQAALTVLLAAVTQDVSPSRWCTRDGLDMMAELYAILAKTGYQPGDEENEVLAGSLLKPAD